MTVDPRDSEALSRLLDGELSTDDEAALLARIDAEPALERAWEAMQALPSEIAGLPDMPPPPALDDRVMEGEPERAGGWNRGHAIAAALAAAAALLVLVLWPADPAQIVLIEGEEWVDGQATVLAAGVPVEVDGVARISVEPSPGSLRERGQEVESMDWKHAAAAVAGAAITVAVYEGVARIGGEHPDTVEAGERWSKTAETQREDPARRVVTRTGGPVASDDEDDPAVLRARIDELEQALATADFEDAIQRGRIAAVEGTPQAWPEALPPELHADHFEDGLADALAGHDELELLEVNCDEYPCYAIIEADPESIGPGAKPGGGFLEAWAEGIEGDVGVWNMMSVMAGPEGEVGLMGVALIDGGGEPNEDLSTRLHYRMEGSVKGWTEDIIGELEGASEDVEVEG